MSELERFFATVEPFLFGERDVAEVEAALGPSASGRDNLDFYRQLVARNYDKLLRELFAPVRTLSDRLHPGLWPTLVREFTAAHPGRARDPNWAGEPFSGFLAERRQQHPQQSPVLEELADYVFCRFAAATAPEPDADDRDGFERRLFVRLYSFPMPEVLTAVSRGENLPPPQPAMLLIYRLLGDELGAAAGVRWHRPDPAQLAALGRRQGLPLPPQLAQLDDTRIRAGTRELIDRRILATD